MNSREIAILSFVVLVCAPALLHAQQWGTTDHDYIVNDNGSVRPSIVETVVSQVMPYQLDWLNLYETNDPAQPVIWATATQAQVGWTTLPGNSIDRGPAGRQFILDGTNPAHPLAPFLRTDTNGTFVAHLSVGPAHAGTDVYAGMIHLSPSSPAGVYISQVHHVLLDTGVNLTPGNPTISGTPYGVPLVGSCAGTGCVMHSALAKPVCQAET